ncbi:hypothetical protein RUND412_000403 [Rhizina undulata]
MPDEFEPAINYRAVPSASRIFATSANDISVGRGTDVRLLSGGSGGGGNSTRKEGTIVVDGVERKILPPKDIPCRFFVKGYCSRGRSCWFKHDPSLVGIEDSKKRESHSGGNENSKGKGRETGNEKCEDGTEAQTSERETCAICFEVPTTYGLLTSCDHVFCLTCIRAWRSTGGSRSTNAHPTWEGNNLQRTSKTCPLCRISSGFIIPSSIFPSPPPAPSTSKHEKPTTMREENDGSGEGDPEVNEEESSREFSCPSNPAKEAIVRQYLRILKNIPCRYFRNSIENPEPRRRRNLIPFCPFFNNCHYAHNHPSNTPYIFTENEQSRHRRAEELRSQRFHVSGDYRRALRYASNRYRGFPPDQVIEMLMTESAWAIGTEWDIPIGYEDDDDVELMPEYDTARWDVEWLTEEDDFEDEDAVEAVVRRIGRDLSLEDQERDGW